jgi:hypothetical protein
MAELTVGCQGRSNFEESTYGGGVRPGFEVLEIRFRNCLIKMRRISNVMIDIGRRCSVPFVQFFMGGVIVLAAA